MVLKISLNFFRYRDHGKIDHYHGNSYFTIKKPAHLNEPVFAVYFLN